MAGSLALSFRPKGEIFLGKGRCAVRVLRFLAVLEMTREGGWRAPRHCHFDGREKSSWVKVDVRFGF